MATRTFSMTNTIRTDVLERLIVKAIKARRNVKGDSFATIAEVDFLVSDPLAVIDGHPAIGRHIVTTVLGTDCSDWSGCIDYQIWDGSRGCMEVIAYFKRDDSIVDDDSFDCDNYAVRNIYTAIN